MPSYKYHIFVCQNQRPEGNSRGCCFSKGSSDLLVYMKRRLKELNIPGTRVNKSGCLDQCEQGPALVIYPEGAWYRPQSTKDVEKIIQSHFVQQRSLPDLKIS